MAYDVEKIRKDFPILEKKIDGKPIVYMDNACMTLKPKQVQEVMNSYYNDYTACGGRSMHKFGKRVSEEVDKSRKKIAKFFNAKSEKEIVFTKNTTEAINLVTNSIALNRGDVILMTDKEHNSNLVPWQLAAQRKGAKLMTVTSKPDNTFDMTDFQMKIKHANIVAMVHTSNLDGTTIPAKDIIKAAHEMGCKVLLDCAQSAPHKEVDVRRLDADFIVCSGHKMLGPTGTGILYGKSECLQELQPFIAGGETVMDSTYVSATFEKPPEKFEGGLQNYAGMIGFGAAIDYLNKIGMDNIQMHEINLNKKMTAALAGKVDIIGPKDAMMRNGIFSFNIKGMDPHNVAGLLDSSANVMIRSGAHCVHSWFNSHGIRGSARASLYLYNTEEEADIFVREVEKIIQHFR